MWELLRVRGGCCERVASRLDASWLCCGNCDCTRAMSLSFFWVAWWILASINPYSPKSCEPYRISERKVSPFDRALLKGQVSVRKFFLDSPGCLGGLDRSRTPDISASRGLGPLETAHGVKLNPSLLTEPRCSRGQSMLGYVGS